METWSKTVTFLTLLLTTPTLTVTNSPLPDITDETFISSCVREHNQNRSSVRPTASNMRYMTWDDGLAVTARAWARNCLFEHNTYLSQKGRCHPVFSPVGENIWAGTMFSVKGAIQSWVAEVEHYHFDPQDCTKVCGHYTQVVWAETYKVGCAVQDCPNGVAETYFFPTAAVIFVCNYATAGNYKGQKPYIKGHPCSNCDGDRCENNLCRNSTRDALKHYNWTPDWDSALSECGSFCKAILITRPVSLAITFISVYTIQVYYPNLFAYTF